MSAMLKQKLIDIANGFTKYGLWKGGSSKLSELDDVTLTNLQSNDVLTYNGSVWANDDNLQKQINTLNRNLEYFVDMKNNNNLFKFTDTYLLQMNCQYGYGAMTIYGFMQNYGAFMVHVACIAGNASIIDVINQASGLGLLKTLWDSNTKKLHIYVESTERPFGGVVIGLLV